MDPKDRAFLQLNTARLDVAGAVNRMNIYKSRVAGLALSPEETAEFLTELNELVKLAGHILAQGARGIQDLTSSPTSSSSTVVPPSSE